METTISGLGFRCYLGPRDVHNEKKRVWGFRIYSIVWGSGLTWGCLGPSVWSFMVLRG